jgi:hypothetical protein
MDNNLTASVECRKTEERVLLAWEARIPAALAQWVNGKNVLFRK